MLDFYCAPARLAVEIDGSGHDHIERMMHDERRDAWLRAQGINVLRIKAADVLYNLDDVTSHILHHCCAFPLHQPAAGPPPHLTMGRIK